MYWLLALVQASKAGSRDRQRARESDQSRLFKPQLSARTHPGATTLERTPRGPSSTAMTFESASIAALAAET